MYILNNFINYYIYYHININKLIYKLNIKSIIYISFGYSHKIWFLVGGIIKLLFFVLHITQFFIYFWHDKFKLF